MFLQSKPELPSIKVSWEYEEYGDLYGQVRVLYPRAHGELAWCLPAFRRISLLPLLDS
jgi:hypothetical protein